jgi:CheY-like chemotaxis protein
VEVIVATLHIDADTATLLNPPPAWQGLRYRKLREHATGGLGIVHVAHTPPAEGVVEPVHPEQASRILLVDDDPRLLTVLSDTLQACGHSVTTAVKGEDALEMFDSTKHDVVITDLGMPRMNGWEVAERVKARSPETPVFLLTGWGESVAAHEGSQFVDRVVAKPVSAEALMEQLAELRRSRAPAP